MEPIKHATELASEADIQAFVGAFNDRILPKEHWTHAAHVAVATAYLWQSDSEAVLPRIRAAIRTYNEATGGANTDDAGYHETLTVFWLKSVETFLRSTRPATVADAVQSSVAYFGPRRDLFKSFYSFDVVRSREARKLWIPPDLKKLDSL